MRALLQSSSGVVLTYEAVLAELRSQGGKVHLHTQPRSLDETLAVLMGALAAGHELTLYDEDFSAAEVFSLIGRNSIPEDTVSLDPVAASSWQEWVQEVQQNAPVGLKLGLFTSGSTGLPKRVIHTWASLARGLRVSADHAEDVWGFTYNPTHIAGVQVMLQALLNGNPLVDLRGLSREEIECQIARHGVTHLSATPSFYRLLLPLQQPNPQVKRVSLGGEGSDEGLRARLREAFPSAKISNIYASTEAGSLFLSEGGVFTVPADLASKVRVKNGGLELHRSLLADFEAGAGREWYATGDEVEVVSESPLAFKIIGRDREWFNVGGHKVNPAEVEAVLLECPGVREARVFGRPNSVLGTLLCAEVVAAEAGSIDETSLRNHAVSRLQPTKVPRIIRFVEAIEQTRSGKMKRS